METKFPAVPLLLGILGLTGCVTPPPAALKPEDIARIQQTDVRICVPRNELRAEFDRTPRTGTVTPNAAGGAAAILMPILAPLFDSVAATKADARVEPIRKATRDLEARRQMGLAISNAISTNLSALAWLKPGKIEIFAAAPDRVAPKKLPKNARLDIESQFVLSPDCLSFITFTRIGFYPPDQSTQPRAANLIAYYSDELPRCDRDTAVRIWSANNGARFRTAFAESLEANARLLSYALQHLGGTRCARTGVAHVGPYFVRGREGLKDSSSLGKHHLTVDVLEETPRRLIFQVKGGALFSVPQR